MVLLLRLDYSFQQSRFYFMTIFKEQRGWLTELQLSRGLKKLLPTEEVIQKIRLPICRTLLKR